MGCCNKGDVGTELDEKKQFDPKFKGPIEWSERRCRDIWMILIYVAFWVGLVIVAWYGADAGDPYRLLNGVDSFGNTCGRENKYRGSLFDPVDADGSGSGSAVITNTPETHPNVGLDMSGYGKLMLFKATSLTTLQLCVAACPSDSVDNPTVADHGQYCLADSPTNTTPANRTNPYVTQSNQYSISNFGTDAAGCPEKIYASTELMNRCVPTGDALDGVVDGVMGSINAGGMVQDFISDTQKSYEAILMIIGITIILAILFVFVMRWFAFVLIWIAYYALLLGSIALLGLLWYMWDDKQTAYDTDLANNITVTESTKTNIDMFFGLAIAWSILGGILIILLIYMHSRVALVVALFKEAGKCIGTMPLVLFYPLWTLLSACICVGYFFALGLYLLSAGHEVIDTDNGDHISYEKSETLQYMTLYHLFGFYWSWEFTLAFQEAVLAGCAASWYFTRDKSELNYTVSHAVWRTIRFSMGSLLFGALIIAIIKMIRFLLHYFEEKVKKISENSDMVKFVMKCIDCCLWCCEKCMKFLNRNAYIEIAIYGKSFCRSAMNAFAILLRNALRVAAINSIGDLVLMISKLIITAIAAVAAFFYFQNKETIAENLGDASTTVPDDVQWESLQIVLITILGYFVANMFIGVYEMMIDTIFICFCEDSERNDGSPQKPYFMSSNLLKFMAGEERRTQKRTEKEYKQAQKKAAAAEATHSNAMGLKIDG